MAKQLRYMSGNEFVRKLNQGEINFPYVKLKEGFDLSGHPGLQIPHTYGFLNIRGSDFTGIIAADLGFICINARDATLTGADLEGTRIIDGNFIDADLEDATLINADLRFANLTGAVLMEADLRYADVRRADFTGANIRGADLRYTLARKQPTFKYAVKE